MVGLFHSDEIERWLRVRAASLGGSRGQSNPVAAPPEYDRGEQVVYRQPTQVDPTMAGLDVLRMSDDQRNWDQQSCLAS